MTVNMLALVALVASDGPAMRLDGAPVDRNSFLGVIESSAGMR